MPLRNAAVGALKQATVTLTAAQIRALLVTPVTLIAAPGAGHWINPHVVVLNYTFGTAPFGTSGDEADFKIYLASQLLDGFGTTLITRTADSFVQRTITGLGPYDSATLANQPLTLQAGNDNSGGSILTSSKGAGGAGYAATNTGTITGGSEQSSDAIYVVDTVSAGAVVTYHLSSAGTNYRPQSGAATVVSTGGGDGNFTVNVLTVTPGDGTCRVDCYYSIESTV